jgi:hypothetical protein
LSTRAQEELKHDQVFPVLRGRATIENHSIRGRLANRINPIWGCSAATHCWDCGHTDQRISASCTI